MCPALKSGLRSPEVLAIPVIKMGFLLTGKAESLLPVHPNRILDSFPRAISHLSVESVCQEPEGLPAISPQIKTPGSSLAPLR